MKKFLLVALIGAMAMPMFQSCKKGPNDPGISLASRKSRLVGEWTIFKGKETINDAGAQTVITIDGTSWNQLVGSVSTPGTTTSEIKIVKDGTYTWKQTITINITGIGAQTRTENMEGNWWFLGANKDAGIKNKQSVAFQCTKSEVTNFGSTTPSFNTYEQASPAVYLIDELKSKEIILMRDYSNSGVTVYTDSEEYTLQPK